MICTASWPFDTARNARPVTSVRDARDDGDGETYQAPSMTSASQSTAPRRHQRQASTSTGTNSTHAPGHQRPPHQGITEGSVNAGTARPHLLRISGARKSVVAVTGEAVRPINVRYAPTSDQVPQRSDMKASAETAISFDHLIGGAEHRWHFEPSSCHLWSGRRFSWKGRDKIRPFHFRQLLATLRAETLCWPFNETMDQCAEADDTTGNSAGAPKSASCRDQRSNSIDTRRMWIPLHRG